LLEILNSNLFAPPMFRFVSAGSNRLHLLFGNNVCNNVSIFNHYTYAVPLLQPCMACMTLRRQPVSPQHAGNAFHLLCACLRRQ
jgi:hypothetical protein